MNVGPSLRFVQSVLRLLDSDASSPRAEENYGWLRESRDAVPCWVSEQAVVESAVQRVRTHGVNRDSATRWMPCGPRRASRRACAKSRPASMQRSLRKACPPAPAKRGSAARRCWNRHSANSSVWKGATPTMASPRCRSPSGHSSANARKPTCVRPSTPVRCSTPSRKKSLTTGATASSAQPSTCSADASSNHKTRTKSGMNNHPRQPQVEITLTMALRPFNPGDLLKSLAMCLVAKVNQPILLQASV